MRNLDQTGTCQICLREIGSKAGVISHHGYRRPNRGAGWQTQSCYGARKQPLEVSCEAIPPYIAMLKNFLATQSEIRDGLLNNPPETLEILPSYGYGEKKIVYNRPAEFNAAANVQQATHTYRTYACEHAGRYREHARYATDTAAEIKIMEERLANWKPAPKRKMVK